MQENFFQYTLELLDGDILVIKDLETKGSISVELKKTKTTIFFESIKEYASKFIDWLGFERPDFLNKKRISEYAIEGFVCQSSNFDNGILDSSFLEHLLDHEIKISEGKIIKIVEINKDKFTKPDIVASVIRNSRSSLVSQGFNVSNVSNIGDASGADGEYSSQDISLETNNTDSDISIEMSNSESFNIDQFLNDSQSSLRCEPLRKDQNLIGNNNAVKNEHQKQTANKIWGGIKSLT